MKPILFLPMAQNLLKSKAGRLDASSGLSIALGAVFILGIGLSVTAGIVDEANLTGITALVVGYAPLIIGAAFLFMVSKSTGMIKA